MAQASAKSQQSPLFDNISNAFNAKEFKKLNERISFQEYLNRVEECPLLACSAYQRLYRMIVMPGVEKFKQFNRTIKRYKFFSENAHYPVFGLEEHIESVVKHIKGAAGYFGPEKRILLLHGPVGSSKSTLCRALKRGLEDYTATDEGALYTFRWKELPEGIALQKDIDSPMHDDPIRLVPIKQRPMLEAALNEKLQKMQLSANADIDKELKFLFKLRLPGELNPADQFNYNALLSKYEGDWAKVMKEHVEVFRVVLNESKRVGIGTFQPKDEKNQDATELTGDVNYMKLGKYGADSDPRAFNFDGEFQVAHRGMLEMIEMLKLNQEFLYDLLGAAQEQQVKPKKFAQVFIDTVIIGHTNAPEFTKLEQNECMEALRDRTVRCDVPYLLRWSDEQKVLEQDYNPKKVRQHIAPHTIRMAALFGILTRLHNAEGNKQLDPVKKAKLYDGQALPGFTEDNVKELRDQNPKEGLDHGISARYLQNKISNALVSHHDYVNPFMVFHELKEGLKKYSVTGQDENRRAFYENCIVLAKGELDEVLKNEVRRALVMDDDIIQRMFLNYIDNVFAYIENKRVKDDYTGEYTDPDERLMRSIEEKIDVPEQGVDDFRRMIAAYVGSLTRNEGKEALTWNKNPDLARALELKLFEDTKDSIKSSLTKVVSMLDPAEQAKIEQVKKRLIAHCGYNDQSATDVLHYVGSIFARGDMMEK